MTPEVQLNPPASPTGQPIIPARYVPLVLLVVAALQFVGAAVALEGPWTAERSFMLAQGILSLLVGGAVPGLRR